MSSNDSTRTPAIIARKRNLHSKSPGWGFFYGTKVGRLIRFRLLCLLIGHFFHHGRDPVDRFLERLQAGKGKQIDLPPQARVSQVQRDPGSHRLGAYPPAGVRNGLVHALRVRVRSSHWRELLRSDIAEKRNHPVKRLHIDRASTFGVDIEVELSVFFGHCDCKQGGAHNVFKVKFRQR